MEAEEVLKRLTERFPGTLRLAPDGAQDRVLIVHGDILLDLMAVLKSPPHNFALLLDVTCLDLRASQGSYEIVYHLLSLSRRARLRVKVAVREEEAAVDSLSGLWKNAGWLEREAFDMFGITFRGHPDLRRILMYEGFEGHPLRKDYPLRKRQPRLPERG